MKLKSLFSDVAASSTDKFATVGINGLYFVLIGALLPKSELGIYALCMAGTSIITQLLTVGSSQIIVRQIASHTAERKAVVGNAFFQRLMFPAVFAVLSLPVLLRNPIPHLWIFVLAYLSNWTMQNAMILRQTLIGEQRFWYSTLTSQVGLGTKLVLGLTLVYLDFGAAGLFLALICGGIAEMVLGLVLIHRLFGELITPRFNWPILLSLLREGFPLMVAFLFNQTLARIDWILMGIIRTASETGEYAFAYRIFEICWLPHAILSTILLPKISYALRGREITKEQKIKINSLHRVVLALSVVLPLGMLFAWSPVIDKFTDGKYGIVNLPVIYVLALVVPFIAGINIMWNLAMARRRQKTIMVSIAAACVMNIGLNLVLIPRLGGLGAAISTAIPMAGQYILYMWWLRPYVFLRPTLVCWASIAFSSSVAFWTVNRFFSGWYFQVFAALTIYVLLIFLTQGVKKRDIVTVLGQKKLY